MPTELDSTQKKLPTGYISNNGNLENQSWYDFKLGISNLGNKLWDGTKSTVSSIGSGLSSFGSGALDFGQNLIGYNPAQKGLTNSQVATQTGTFLNPADNLLYSDKEFKNLAKIDSSYTFNKETGTWDKSGNWNLGQGLGNINNLAQAGVAGWGLYESVKSYKDRKDLLQTQKKTAEEQYNQLVEDRAHLQKERARQDRIRNTAVKQRASSSSVTSW